MKPIPADHAEEIRKLARRWIAAEVGVLDHIMEYGVERVFECITEDDKELLKHKFARMREAEKSLR